VLRLKDNGINWELAEELPLTALLADSGTRIKESRVKLVTKHDIAGKTYYVKRYQHAGVPLRPLKFLLKSSQARQEWQIAQQINAPIVRHLALGERWTLTGLQESILITEGFDGQTPDDWARVLDFVHLLHQRGVLQRDLHPGNILANANELRLVDLHGIVLRTLTDDEIAGNLARLRMSAPIPVSPEIERRSVEFARGFYAERSRRCFKRNWEFDRQDGWFIRKPYLNDALRTILCDPEAFLGQSKLLKQGGTSVVGAGQGFVVKQYNIRRPLRLLKDLFRRSRAVNAYHKAYHLEIAGIPTARPIAARERRCCGVLLRSWFVMEELTGVRDLSQWTGNYKLAAQRVRELVAKLHERGFSHRDLKLTNIMLDAEARPFLVDLEGVRFVGEVTPERAAADLVRLARAAESRPELGL
jgi:serine/threonine protein kinase